MTKNKEGSFRVIALVMLATLLIAFNWEKWAAFREAIHSVLDPSLGALLDWNLTMGMLIIVLVISIAMTFVQKYTTDQDELKKIKKTQKELQTKSKEFKHDPKKAMEIQKEIMPLTMKQMKLGMRTIVYTGIPFVLLFRWFNDYFMNPALEGVKLLGIFNWFWFYLIFTLIFSSILKKKFDVV